MNNLFLKQFAGNIKFSYTCQLNVHIKKDADRLGIPIIWWPSVDGGKNGAKLEYVDRHFVKGVHPKGDLIYCIITDTETHDELCNQRAKVEEGKGLPGQVYKCKKLVKHYYIYFHDHVFVGPCYLKISSYLPFPCEFYFNGHNAIKQQFDQKGIDYRVKDNAFTWVEDPGALKQISQSIKVRQVKGRIDYWLGRFFKFDKGIYSTRSKYLQHDWYMGQTEVCTNMIFKSARFCTNLFERLLDKFSRIGLPDSLSQIFSKRAVRQTKSTHRLYANNACVIGSEATPLRCITRKVISCGWRPQSTTPNRWGLKNLSCIYRHICGIAWDVMTDSQTAVLMLILHPLPRVNQIDSQNRSLLEMGKRFQP